MTAKCPDTLCRVPTIIFVLSFFSLGADWASGQVLLSLDESERSETFSLDCSELQELSVSVGLSGTLDSSCTFKCRSSSWSTQNRSVTSKICLHLLLILLISAEREAIKLFILGNSLADESSLLSTSSTSFATLWFTSSSNVRILFLCLDTIKSWQFK